MLTSGDLSLAERAGLAALADSNAALVSQAMAWSRISSGSGNLPGLRLMADALEAAFATLGGAMKRETLPAFTMIGPDGRDTTHDTGDALWVEMRPEAPVQVALTGHYDTVFGPDHAFTTPVRCLDGRINGPGMADMKGGLALMLAALTAFERLPDAGKVGWRVLLSPDEEIGSPASSGLLAALGAKARLGLTFEPAMADGALAAARKGSGKFALVVHGRAAHAGRDFALGRNALAHAARLAAEIDTLNGRHPDITFNIGRIDGGGPLNIVPDCAVIRFEARVAAREDADRATGWLAGILAAGNQREGLSAQLHGGFHRPVKPMGPGYDYLLRHARDCARVIGFDLAWRDSGGVCEGNNLAAAGCVNIDTLGPIGGALHSADEWADAASFAPRAQLSFLLLANLAAGRLDLSQLAARPDDA